MLKAFDCKQTACAMIPLPGFEQAGYFGTAPVYQNAPTFAQRIGKIEIDKEEAIRCSTGQALIYAAE